MTWAIQRNATVQAIPETRDRSRRRWSSARVSAGESIVLDMRAVSIPDSCASCSLEVETLACTHDDFHARAGSPALVRDERRPRESGGGEPGRRLLLGSRAGGAFRRGLLRALGKFCMVAGGLRGRRLEDAATSRSRRSESPARRWSPPG